MWVKPQPLVNWHINLRRRAKPSIWAVSYTHLKEPFTRHLVYGSIMALIGVGLVVFNGSFILKINPLGDILSLTAALMWAFYCLILKQLDNHYSIVFITRKVFFYGVLTILPMFLFRPLNWDNILICLLYTSSRYNYRWHCPLS